MALQHPYSHNGVDYEEAYWKIDNFAGAAHMAFAVRVYTNAAARFAAEPPLVVLEYGQMTVPETSVFPAMYDFLKGQDGMEGAVDV